MIKMFPFLGAHFHYVKDEIIHYICWVNIIDKPENLCSFGRENFIHICFAVSSSPTEHNLTMITETKGKLLSASLLVYKNAQH